MKLYYIPMGLYKRPNQNLIFYILVTIIIKKNEICRVGLYNPIGLP